MFLTLGAGYVVSSICCYLVCWAFSPRAFVPVAAAALLYFATGARKSPGEWAARFRRGASRLWLDFDPILVVIVTIVAARYLVVYCYLFDNGSGSIIYRQYMVDNLFNTGMCHEISRGVPLAQMPNMSGLPFFRYHFMGSFFVWMTATFSGADMIRVFHVYAPVIFNILIVGHVYFLCARLGGGRPFGAAGAVLLFLLYFPSEKLLFYFRFMPPSDFELTWIYKSFSAFAGLPVAAAFFHMLAIRSRAPGERAPGIAAGFFAAALFLFKANFGLALFPAFALHSAAGLVSPKRDTGKTAVELAAAAASLALIWLIFSKYSQITNIIFEFGEYAAYLRYKYFYFDAPVLILFNRLPDPVVLTISAVFRPLLDNSGVIFPFMALYFLTGRKGDGGLKSFSLFFYIAVAFIFLFLRDSRHAMNLAKDLHHCSYLFSVIPGILGIRIAWERLMSSRAAAGSRAPIWKAAAAALLVASVIGSAATTFGPKELYAYPIDRGDMAAWVYIKNNTPPDSVILLSDYENGAENMFGGRRSVLELIWPKISFPGVFERRTRDISVFFNTKDTAAARAILDEYGADYVLASAGARIHFPFEGLLEKKFESGNTIVYRRLPAR